MKTFEEGEAALEGEKKSGFWSRFFGGTKKEDNMSTKSNKSTSSSASNLSKNEKNKNKDSTRVDSFFRQNLGDGGTEGYHRIAKQMSMEAKNKIDKEE